MKLTMNLDNLRHGWFSKLAAYTSVAIFTFVFYISPTAQAVAQELSEDERRQAALESMLESTPEAKLAHRLQKLKNNVLYTLPEKMEERESTQDVFEAIMAFLLFNKKIIEEDELEEITELKESITLAYEEAKFGFDETKSHIEEMVASEKMPEVALERHLLAQQQIETQYAELQNNVEGLVAAENYDDQKAALEQLSNFLEQQQFKTTHSVENPDRMPFGTPSKDVREPNLTEEDLQAAIGVNPHANYVQLASLDASSSLILNAISAIGTPIPADLLPTIDAQQSDEIITLAASLNNNPTEIYAWVHNNIRFIPSYGSIQGAQMTLETKRGNAMDTASLLIALLRASGIPARYAYGTVEIPVDQAMNWVGGVEVPEAALNLMGQGGIPSIGLSQGGVITDIRLEHTWVEAWVDFEPSRGVNNQSGDNWIPMDASFKQYEFTDGFDLENNVPFDAQTLIDDITAASTINESEGWAQNVPQQAIEDQLTQFQQEIETYITNQNPNATVGEVLGLQDITIIPAQPLSAGLPYQHIVTQSSFSEVTDNLRHRFKYELATQVYGYPNSPFITINEPTVVLAGKKLALSFAPATAEDEKIIESYFPELNSVTDEFDPNDFPGVLPGYLIDLKAEFSIENNTVQTMSAGTMGAELYETLQLWSPKSGWQVPAVNHPIAGEYRAILLDLQGITGESARRQKDEIDEIVGVLNDGNEQELLDLGKNRAVGNIFSSTLFTYFGFLDAFDETLSQELKVVSYRLPSYGIFSTQIDTSYWFGVPRNTEYVGLSIDIDAVTTQVVSKDNSLPRQINYVRALGGKASALEHIVPEELSKFDGVSAIKALAVAMESGQKIWTINDTNLNTALAQLSFDQDTLVEIANAVNSGKTVITHNSSLSIGNWFGEGYILYDTETGSGAYKISGGTNGGFTPVGETLGVGAMVLHYGKEFVHIYHEIRNNKVPYSALASISLVLKGMILALEQVIEYGNFDLVEQEFLTFALSGLNAAYSISYFDELTVAATPALPIVMFSIGYVLGVYVAPYLSAVYKSQ